MGKRRDEGTKDISPVMGYEITLLVLLHFLIPFNGHWDLSPPEEAAALP